MVLIEEITNEVVSSALETALESELSAEPIQHIFRALRDEDRLVTTMALRVHQAAPITLTITPSPVRRPSQLRAHRSSSPTWIDGIYAEMVAADAERARKRSALSPPRMIEEVTTLAKRQRWSVDDVDSALSACSLSTHSASGGGGGSSGSSSSALIVKPTPTMRLVRWERKNAARQAARKQQRALRRGCGDSDLHALDLAFTSALLVTRP